MMSRATMALLEELSDVARRAGDAIAEIYRASPQADTKADGSPVTLADQRAEAVILENLAEIAPDIIVISEENSASHSLDAPERYFLVDPLDGTREFLKRDGLGAFTVNIALIEHAVPVLGVVHAPLLNRLFCGLRGAEGSIAFENGTQIKARAAIEGCAVALASISHPDQGTAAWLESNPHASIRTIGSSLKFGLLAAGEADTYPRFGPTMEWDTAAGDAVLRAAGGRMETPDGAPFLYGKPGFRNTPFIARGK
ncbi:MAG: 3'(2'),5'-bisphosphate nucleotidase CysQ [Ahrensia sp.]|nr:3'(2'),5'-bisphosphate nucleotidase CysQ [Ahrensia sp.]